MSESAREFVVRLMSKYFTSPGNGIAESAEMIESHDADVRRKALEDAARVCDSVGPNKWVTGCDCWELSKAIRSLIDKEQ